jgi:site-specific recombinase XerD
MWGVQMNPHESINQPLLYAFDDYNRAKRLSQHTIDIQNQQMRLFDKNANKPFQDITRTDIEQFLEHVNTCYAERSVNHMKMVLKKFFKWFSEKQLGTEIEKIQKDMGKKGKSQFDIDKKIWELSNQRSKYPYSVSWIKCTYKGSNLTEKDILTPDEVWKLISTADHPQTKALISVLWDVAMREGQLCSLNVGDLIIHEGKIDVSVEMDGGERRVIPLVDSVPYLIEWLNHSKYKDQPEKPLFYSLSNRAYGERYSTNGIYFIIKKTARKAGFRRNVYPHLIRHSRCTYWKKTGVDSATIKHIGLWKMNSNIPDTTYTHLCSNDHRNVILKSQGLQPVEVSNNNSLALNYCPRCGEGNPATNPYCRKCREPLSEYAKREHEQLQKKIMEEEIKRQIDKILTSIFGKMLLQRRIEDDSFRTQDGKVLIPKQVIIQPPTPTQIIDQYKEFEKSVKEIVENARKNGISPEEIKKYEKDMAKLLS